MPLSSKILLQTVLLRANPTSITMLLVLQLPLRSIVEVQWAVKAQTLKTASGFSCYFKPLSSLSCYKHCTIINVCVFIRTRRALLFLWHPRSLSIASNTSSPCRGSCSVRLLLRRAETGWFLQFSLFLCGFNFTFADIQGKVYFER